MAAVAHRPRGQYHEPPNQSYTSESSLSQEPSQQLWRDLAKICQDTLESVTPEKELEDLSRAEEIAERKQDEQDRTLYKSREEIKALQRELDSAKHKALRPPSVPTTEQHDISIRKLDQQQYASSKALRDEQASVAKKEAELQRWKGEKEDVERRDVGEEGYMDPKIIRLKLYADAGFQLIPPKEDSGAAKILIRNDDTPDIHTVSIDKTRSRVNTANYIWSLASNEV